MTLSVSLEGSASPNVPDLRRLRLHPVPNVPWQQDVRVSQLLHGFLQSPQVYFLQRERPAAVCELQPVRMFSAWPDILASRLRDQNTGASTGLYETQQDSSSTAIDSKDTKKKWICNKKICEFVDLALTDWVYWVNTSWTSFTSPKLVI